MSSEPRSVVVHQSWCRVGQMQGQPCTCGVLAIRSDGSRSERLSRPDLFMAVAELYGQRSSCPRANVGVVAVREGRIIAAGYCGAASGMRHCTEVGCEIGEDGGCERSVHAEANMIAWAARIGTQLDPCVVYCTHSPCYNCAKLLANAGIIGMQFKDEYRDRRGINLLVNLGIEVNASPPRF